MPPPPREDLDFDPAEPTDPELTEILDPDQINFTPGQYCSVDPPDRLPLRFWLNLRSAVVHIKSASDGKTWDLRAQALPFGVGSGRPRPKRLLGFKVPQLPGGGYQAWCQYGAQKGPERALTITPRLSATGFVTGKRGQNINLSVWVVGPLTVPPQSGTSGETAFQTPITLQTRAPAVVDLASGQPATVSTDPAGRTSFTVELKDFGRADLEASAPGFAPVTLKVRVVPSTPLPVVFVPGTGGSELRMPGNGLFWIGPPTLSPTAITQGALNTDGSDTGQVKMTPTRPLGAFSFPLPAGVVAALNLAGMMIQSPFVVEPLYDPFLAWARGTFPHWADAPYDWRRAACAENAQLLDRAVQGALQGTNGEHKKVILLAHSLGGLVSRDYFAGLGQGKVDALIAVGTPWLGAPKTARALLWGYDFDVGEASPSSQYVTVTGLMGPLGGSRIEYPVRVSFLNPSETREIAKHFPCVFQQLPTSEFMRMYGEASGRRQSRSVIFEVSDQDANSFFRQQNATLFAQAQQWRQRIFNRNFGVAHYLIAAVCDPRCDLKDRMDMEMAQPSQVNKVGNRADPQDLANWSTIAAREQSISTANDVASTAGFRVHRNEYVTTDSQTSWGDGTAALLSATAGAQLREGAPLNPRGADQFLGPDTRVRVLKLDPAWGHGSMLNDPGVRQQIQQIYTERNQLLGVDPAIEQVVWGVTIQVATKDNGLNPFNDFGTFDAVFADIVDLPVDRMEINNALPRADLLNGSVSRWVFPNPQLKDSRGNIIRGLRMSDWAGNTFRLSKPGFDDWTCTGVSVWMNATEVVHFEDPNGFILTLNNPIRLFQLPSH